MDFRQYYDMESHLFDTVRQRFAANGCLDAVDLFCIVIWKANRAKTKIAKRVLAKGHKNLEEAVHELTSGIARQGTAKRRLYYLLWEWELRLPMATAILTVLYPDEFTIYDTRVCSQLNAYDDLQYFSNYDMLWEGYTRFRRSVVDAAPAGLSLRDTDRWLWGKSFFEQLTHDVAKGFGQVQEDVAE